MRNINNRPVPGTREHFKKTLESYNVGAIVSIMEMYVIKVTTNHSDTALLEMALQECKPAGCHIIVKTHKNRSYYGVTWCNPARWEVLLYRLEKWFS